jgi:hypothetical protein
MHINIHIRLAWVVQVLLEAVEKMTLDAIPRGAKRGGALVSERQFEQSITKLMLNIIEPIAFPFCVTSRGTLFSSDFV